MTELQIKIVATNKLLHKRIIELSEYVRELRAEFGYDKII
jgi:hypothetical protein